MLKLFIKRKRIRSKKISSNFSAFVCQHNCCKTIAQVNGNFSERQRSKCRLSVWFSEGMFYKNGYVFRINKGSGVGNQNKHTVTVCLDLSKAFGSGEHNRDNREQRGVEKHEARLIN